MPLQEKLANLAADLERLMTEGGPTPEELADAPILSDWKVVDYPAVSLEGFVVGHPKLGAGHITTTQVYAVAMDGTWMRTLSRLYRLGPPLS